MIRIKWEEELRPEDFEGDAAAIAEAIGVEALLKLARLHGGGHLYVPKVESLTSPARRRWVLEHSDLPIRELRAATNFSDTHLERMLSSPNDPRQVDMFGDGDDVE